MPVIGAVDMSESEKHALLVFWLCQVLNTDDQLLPLRMTKRDPDVTGRCMTDEMMSRAEIITALERLPVVEEAVLRLTYGPSKYPAAEIGRIIRKSERTVRTYCTSGIRRMTERIFDV